MITGIYQNLLESAFRVYNIIVGESAPGRQPLIDSCARAPGATFATHSRISESVIPRVGRVSYLNYGILPEFW